MNSYTADLFKLLTPQFGVWKKKSSINWYLVCTERERKKVKVSDLGRGKPGRNRWPCLAFNSSIVFSSSSSPWKVYILHSGWSAYGRLVGLALTPFSERIQTHILCKNSLFTKHKLETTRYCGGKMARLWGPERTWAWVPEQMLHSCSSFVPQPFCLSSVSLNMRAAQRDWSVRDLCEQREEAALKILTCSAASGSWAMSIQPCGIGLILIPRAVYSIHSIFQITVQHRACSWESLVWVMSRSNSA